MLKTAVGLEEGVDPSTGGRLSYKQWLVWMRVRNLNLTDMLLRTEPPPPPPSFTSTAISDHFLSNDQSPTDIEPIPLELIIHLLTHFAKLGKRTFTLRPLTGEKRCKLCLFLLYIPSFLSYLVTLYSFFLGRLYCNVFLVT